MKGPFLTNKNCLKQRTPEVAPAKEGDPVPKSKNEKRFHDSRFKQQNLNTMRPIYMAENVLVLFLVVGVAFISIGIGIYCLSNEAKELVRDYTDCMSMESPNKTCHEIITANKSAECTCVVITDNIGTGWTKDVFLYYGLTNYYQNHRNYVKSRDDNQLLGDFTSPPSVDCQPFQGTGDKVYIPCGAIANSLFSDTIKMSYLSPESLSDWEHIGLIRTGIAWDSDKKYKFQNPRLANQTQVTLKEALLAANYVRPPNWHQDLWELDPENPENNGLQNEDLIVWMKTAGLPNFRKLYRRINHTEELEKGLPNTKLKFTITYRYDVKSFSGTKSVTVATMSFLGGKNNFLCLAFIFVGCICICLSAFLFFVCIKYKKLSGCWNQSFFKTTFHSMLE